MLRPGPYASYAYMGASVWPGGAVTVPGGGRAADAMARAAQIIHKPRPRHHHRGHHDHDARIMPLSASRLCRLLAASSRASHDSNKTTVMNSSSPWSCLSRRQHAQLPSKFPVIVLALLISRAMFSRLRVRRRASFHASCSSFWRRSWAEGEPPSAVASFHRCCCSAL